MPGVLPLRVIRNTGAAFSIGTGMTIVFTVIAARRGGRHPAHRAQAAQPAVGDHPGPAARRGARQPDRPAAALPVRLRQAPSSRGTWSTGSMLPGHFPVDRLLRRSSTCADSAIVCGGDPAPSSWPGAGYQTRRHARQGAAKTMAEQRSLPVPDGLEGERLDAALARLFGFSRTRAAELIAAGDVLVDGRAAGQVRPGARGRLAGGHAARRRPTAPMPVAEPVPGMAIVYEDDDIVVVDKPIGVAAHPTAGWTGPTVHRRPARRRAHGRHQRRGRAAGHRAPAGRQHHRRDGRGQERARLLARSSGPSRSAPSTSATTRWSRGIPTRCAARSTRRSTGTRPATAGSPWSRAARPSVTHYDTIEAFRAASACSTSSWRPAAPTRSGCTCPRCATRAWATCCTAPTRRWPPGSGVTRQWLHAVSPRLRAPRRRASGHVQQRLPGRPAEGPGHRTSGVLTRRPSDTVRAES